MLRKNNKGLSLVELIVAVAILAIVSIGIMGFVSFSSRNYSQANKNVKLQYEQQMVVNNIRDIVLETSRGIAYDDTAHALTIFSDTASSSLAVGIDPATAPIIVSRIYFTAPATGEETGTLSLLTNTLAAADIDGKSYSDITISGTGDILTDTVKDFSADLSDVGKGKVTLHITFKVGEKEVEVHPEIALRNMIDIIGEDTKMDELYDKEVIEFSSVVSKVEISRDGKVFGQAKTDTVAMAGDSTTVDYDAIVTKKSYYKDEIDETVKWELDGVKAEGIGKCIILDEVTGRLTLKNDGDKTPLDYIEAGTFIIKAISNEDPTKIARLRIKVTTGGVYPVSVTFTETHEQDLVSAQVVYQFAHSITYTDKIKNSAGVEVNPLDGSEVFTKITYKVYESDRTTIAEIPKGAGFSTTTVDGVFRAVKSMEGKTYSIKVSVLQKDKNGDEVYAWLDLKIENVPDTAMEFTVPQMYTADEYRRADDNAVSVQWTNGVPTYGDGKTPYYYWYEWEIEPVDGWGNDDRNKFDGNAYFKHGNSLTNVGTSFTSSQTESRMALVYIEPRVDWAKTFTLRVNVRAKLAKSNKPVTEQYMVTKSGTPIFENDSTMNWTVGSIPSGSTVDVIGQSGDDYQVTYNGITGYVRRSEVTYNKSYNTRRSNVWLYTSWVRMVTANPNSSYDIRIDNSGTSINIVSNPYDRSENARVNYNGTEYYIRGNDYNIIETYTANSNLKMYRYAGDRNELIEFVPAGTELPYKGTDYWKTYTTEYNGQTGYIFRQYYSVEIKSRTIDVDDYYYKLPTNKDNLEDILTKDKSEAYVSSKLVTINPVTLKFTPAETTFLDNNKQGNDKTPYAYFDTRDTVYLGKGSYGRINNYNAGEAYKYYGVEKKNSSYYGYRLETTKDNIPYYRDYYKCFIPEFTGIRVDIMNYSEVLGNVRKNLNVNGSSISALQPYAYETVGGERMLKWQTLDGNWFDSGYIYNNSVDNKLYFYVKMTPYLWGQRFDPFPAGVRWMCVVEGKDSRNYVIANSVKGEDYYFNYKVKYELDTSK